MVGHASTTYVLLARLAALFGVPAATNEAVIPPQQQQAPSTQPLIAAPSLAQHHSMHRSAPGTVPARPRNTAPPPLGRQGVWYVTEFGAVGDNFTDNTGPFAKALAACRAARGGEVVAPPGLWRFTGNLSVPVGCTLSGSYASVAGDPICTSHNVGVVGGCLPAAGTVLMPTGGRGTSCDVPVESPNGGIPCEEAFITLEATATVRGMIIYHPEQETVQRPVPYPWTIIMKGDNAAATDLECLNSWNCVAAVQSSRHYIARVAGQALNIGVFVDQSYDIGRIEDVHFNPWFSVHSPFIYHQTTHGRAFVFGRADWEYVLNTFAFGYAIGYHFLQTPTGAMNGNLLGIGQDCATNASIQVDATQAAGGGLLITNGEFTSFRTCSAGCSACGGGFVDPSLGDDGSEPMQIKVRANNTGAIKFVDCGFWGPTHKIAELDGHGTTTFDACSFLQWGGATMQANISAMTQRGGNLILTSNEFMQPTRHLDILSGAKKTLVTGNIFAGALDISNSVGPWITNATSCDAVPTVCRVGKCGFSGITPTECAARGCCFDDQNPATWCYYKSCPQKQVIELNLDESAGPPAPAGAAARVAVVERRIAQAGGVHEWLAELRQMLDNGLISVEEAAQARRNALGFE